MPHDVLHDGFICTDTCGCVAAALYGGKKPKLLWLCPLDVGQHQLLNPIYGKVGHFRYKPQFTDDFSAIDWVQTPRFHLLQLKVGENATVVGFNVNTDGARTFKRTTTNFVYIQCANGMGEAATHLSSVQVIACLPDLETDLGLYNNDKERRKYAELHLFQACFKAIFAKFHKASYE